MSTVNEYKFVSQKNKDLINGYIREIQALFPAKLVYFNIPPSINQLCALFYTIRGYFNTELCAKDLKFINEKTVTKIKRDGHALCLFGEPISSSMCRMFRIEFTIKKKGRYGFFCPYFGFAASDSISELMASLKSITNWNIYNAKFWLKDGSYGPGYSISMYSSSNNFEWNGGDKIASVSKMDVNDTFMFVHCFDESKCTAYHNDNRIYEFSMDAQCFIPTLSLYYKGEEIEVTKYEFE